LALEHASSGPRDKAAVQESKAIQSQNGQKPIGDQDEKGIPASKETYEKMWLHDQEYLCTIPIVDAPVRNETSEAQALAEEKKELARATDRGWELLQDLEGNCLYFISGWWSYSFCYNSEVTQFHQLPSQQGRHPFPPQRDLTYPQYILGKVKSNKKDKEDEWGNEIEVHKDQMPTDPPTTELQIKGDTRYLVQKMDGGTTCDLTGKPRRIEIQYHCNPQVSDVIGWIKEVTTCSYVMVIYTSRLCDDVAFLPPKERKANVIACAQIVPDDEVSSWKLRKTSEAEISMRGGEPKTSPISIGGIVLGGGKHFGKGGPKLQLPANWQGGTQGPAVDVIARSKGKAENNKVEVMSAEALQKLDLDPEVVEKLQNELQKMAGDKGWKLEIVEVPGEIREIRGVVDSDEDEEGEGSESKDGDENDTGSEETYVEEL
jgi:protein OS-9